MFSLLFIVVGLIVFEVVNSIDNAIVNAHTLKLVSPKARRWFFLWGMITAVLVVRGLLPFLLLWFTAPGTPLKQMFLAVVGLNPQLQTSLQIDAFILLLSGGMFLVLLYLHWLFLEQKSPYFVPDKLVKKHHGVWFFGLAAIILVVVLYAARGETAGMMAVALGNAAFFIIYGLRQTAEREEKTLEHTIRSDISRLLFLEVIDAAFSFDSVVGAFAFTTNILLIFIGNGIGALVVRQLTISNIERVTQYRWIKNGAMTSIGFLGIFMILGGLGIHLPEWLPTITTLLVVGVTFWDSHRLLVRQRRLSALD